MPIYEFHCMDCNHRFQDLIPIGSQEVPACAKCGSVKVSRLISRFRLGRGEDARLDQVADTLSSHDFSETPDDFREQMKEMGKALDEDLSGEMEAIFEQEIAPEIT